MEIADFGFGRGVAAGVGGAISVDKGGTFAWSVAGAVCSVGFIGFGGAKAAAGAGEEIVAASCESAHGLAQQINQNATQRKRSGFGINVQNLNQRSSNLQLCATSLADFAKTRW